MCYEKKLRTKPLTSTKIIASDLVCLIVTYVCLDVDNIYSDKRLFVALAAARRGEENISVLAFVLHFAHYTVMFFFTSTRRTLNV